MIYWLIQFLKKPLKLGTALEANVSQHFKIYRITAV